MKNFFILINILCSNLCFAQKDISGNNDEVVFTIVEKMPVFKGGDDAMIKFIQKNIKYPEMEMEAKISGTCYITFIVEKNGELTGMKILKGVPGGPGCDKEALRVLNKMPKWKPGKQNGKKVRVQYNLPIKYML